MSSRTDQRVDQAAAPEPAESSTRVTRKLSACVHLDDEACDALREEFRIKPHEAVAPSYSVDAVAVVGHTRSAHRHHLLRDVVLLGLLTGMVVTVWRAIPPDKRFPTIMASIVLLVIAWTLGWWIRSSMKTETVAAAAQAYYAEHRLGAAGDLAGATVILVAILAFLVAKADLHAEIVMLVVLLGSAWLVVAIERYVALHLADQVIAAGNPVSLGAAKLPVKLTEDLTRIHSPERNLIVYHGWVNFHDTFVGSGEQLDAHEFNIDVSIGRQDEKGVLLVPQTVDVVDLHRTLERALLSVGAPGCWGGNRTYVDGRSVPLQRDEQFDPLDVVIDDNLILAGLREDHSLYRTYLCIQITTWRGDLVVTLFMRATLTGRSNLHVSTKIYVLAPLRLTFHEYLRPLTPYGLKRLVVAVTYATRNVVPRLLRSPQRCAGVPAGLVQRSLRHRWEQWQISHGEFFDYGATRSVRELFADPQNIHANAWDDVVRQVHLLQTGYITALETYLREHDIDTNSLTESVHNLHLHQENTLTIEKVHNLATGKHGKAGDRHKTRPASKNGPAPTGTANGQASSSGTGS